MSQSYPFPPLPDRIKGLADLSYNLWWSWHPQARDLFRDLGLQPWRESRHNPIRQLAIVPAATLNEAAADPDYLERYDAVMARFANEMNASGGWFTDTYGRAEAPMAYMSAEYGLHASLPTYAGGLGILAGDFLKECSDLGIPLVAVGLIYSEGYVQQRIREDGWQEDVQTVLDRTYDPITPVLDDRGERLVVQVPVFDPPLHVTAWKVAVGRVPLYLLDADLEINQPWDRAVGQHLYATDLEQRLRQEIVLGMGGMAFLRALGLQPAGLHINEGHPALAILERVRAAVAAGEDYPQAFGRVRHSTVFTTHTPVAAGTDVYPFQLMQKYFTTYWQTMKVEMKEFLNLGVNPADPGSGFNMTVFALRAAEHCNAVSRRHAQVARRMWAGVWPGVGEDDAPIAAITNGVHLSTWIELVRLQPLLDRYLGADWRAALDRPDTWNRVDDIPDAELWKAHQDLKVMLITQINERARQRWHQDKIAASSTLALGALLDTEILTIGFARRFTGYKRAGLIFHDLERIKRLLTDSLRPVQLVFAGIAHPADLEGKRLIQTIFRLAQDPDFAARIAFVEDYDQQLAQYLVHGVDVWLNNPLPPLEASGTSGMKAAVNAIPNLAILDGWWIEGYNGENGWGFGGGDISGDRTGSDADALYRLIEDEVIPLYYERSADEVPHGFVRRMKAAVKSVAPAFSSRRMAKEYAGKFYVQALPLKEQVPVPGQGG